MEDPFLLEKEYEKEKANIVGKRNTQSFTHLVDALNPNT